jgi:hypothetical protein
VNSLILNNIPAPGVGLLMCVALISAPLGAGCGKPELQSHWRDRDVTIDGVVGVEGEPDREWTGSRYALEDQNVAVGLLNDEEYLYISLETRDRRIGMQLIGMGFTVWFDPDGGDDRVLGVQFPLGRAGQDPGMNS